MMGPRIWISLALAAWVGILSVPRIALAQTTPTPSTGVAVDPPLIATNTAAVGPWELTVEGRVGVPTGRLKVGEFFPGAGAPGTLLRPHTLGIDVSGAVEASAAFHLTPRDAVRASYLYYFLRGSTSVDGPSVVYNGLEFGAGRLETNADLQRLSLAYERGLIGRPSGEQLIGSLGLTYVHLNPTLTGHVPPQPGSPGETHGRSPEDFFRQELPVPILGLRWEHPFGGHWLLRAGVSGGGLPKVDSLRQEGGTVYLRQSHADVSLGLAYIFGRHAELEAGYHFTYFFQHEQSHEDTNLFELIDNSAQLRFTLRF